MEPFATRIAQAIAAEVGRPVDEVRGLVQTSNNPERGELALACFALAAKLGRPGKEGALGLASDLARLELTDVTAEAAGPFVNFKIAPQALASAVLTAVWTDPNYGGSDEGAGATVVIDFSSPNIAKPFHLGHLRSTVIGWSLRQIFRALGYQVVGVNHLGDWGTQFGFMITAWERWEAEATQRLQAGERETEVFVDLYVRINALAKEDPRVRDEARGWFRKLEEGDPRARELWTFFVERSKREVERIYELLGIVHESDAGEAFYNDKMTATVERLRASGLLVEGKTRKEAAEEKAALAARRAKSTRAELASLEAKLAKLGDDAKTQKERKKLEKKRDKAHADLPDLEAEAAKAQKAVPAAEDGRRPLGVDLSAQGLGFVMLLKGDGGTTYTTRDLTAALYRIETYAPAKILYVVGNTQRDHFVPWFEVLGKLGLPWTGELVHVGFGNYLGMSTRGGTAVFLDEVLERAREQARDMAAQATKKVQLSPEETERVVQAIGTAAIKFFDLKAERTKDIDLSRPGGGGIDWERLLDLRGDSGPYLQFAYARLAGILRRYEGQVDLALADFRLLGEPEAQALLRVLAEFPSTVRQAAERYEPSVISRYVVDLAQKTHAFVHHHRVIDAPPSDEQAALGATAEALRSTRVLLVTAAQKVIAKGFDLLGIEALEQM